MIVYCFEQSNMIDYPANDIDISNTFDRSKVYCRILRHEENKYKVGLNSQDTKFQKSEFYFTDIESAFCFAFTWGTKFCYVTIPENQKIYKQPPPPYCPEENVWRAEKIILSEPYSLTPLFIEDLVKQGAKCREETIKELMLALSSCFESKINKWIYDENGIVTYQSQNIEIDELKKIIETFNKYI